jgi:hypothetical protein
MTPCPELIRIARIMADAPDTDGILYQLHYHLQHCYVCQENAARARMAYELMSKTATEILARLQRETNR